MKNKYDIFIDEEKTMGYIGFLVVDNVPALQQILFNIRNSHQNNRSEIKYVTVNNTRIHIILSWINVFFSNDFCINYYYRKWNGDTNQKRNIIIKTINQIKGSLGGNKNIVAFMDFDSNHKNINIQNQITNSTNIIRCYHADSKMFDMLQLCDVLLQCAIKMESISWNNNEYIKLRGKMKKSVSMKKPELKKLIILHAIKMDKKNKKIRKKIY